jgi:hypothetical protein
VPYFSGAKVGYGGRGMRAAIEKAHSLPGRPKVVVVDFYYALSKASIPVVRKYCDRPDLPEELRPECMGALSRAADRFESFTRHSAEANREAAADANAASNDGAYAIAADGLFTYDQAVLARNAKLWGDFTADPAYPLRRQACPELSPTPSQCLTAAVAHPDIAGSKQYADNMLLAPQLRRWFGLPAAEHPFSVSNTIGPVGLKVTFTAPAGADGERFHWYFGDGAELVTTEPTASHIYDGAGPNLPRLVVESPDGARSLTEATTPIVIGG